MIDFHSHILPGMDDGSKSTQESLEMLDMLRAQGVDTVAATPHFYARENPPEVFLRRRAEAWNRLRPQLTADSPRVLLGAEVRYFQGISHVDRLHDLCLEGQDVLLLEMPFSPWPSRTLAELTDLAQRGDLTVVLAHMERYLAQQPRTLWPREHGSARGGRPQPACARPTGGFFRCSPGRASRARRRPEAGSACKKG